MSAVRAVAIIFIGVLLGASLAPPAQASRDWSPLPSTELCPVGEQEYIVDTFPYEMSLRKSYFYDEGPRSCSYREKREITYWCEADDIDDRTALNVIANGPNSTRKVFPLVCDGKLHTGGAELYPDAPGPYHLHWHLWDGYWDDAFMSVGRVVES